MPDSFTQRFAAGFAGYGQRPCIEFEGRWYTGNEITAYAEAIAGCLRKAGVPDDAPVGIVVRNRVPHAAAVAGFVAAGRPVVMIYSYQPPEAIGRDVQTLGLAAVVADREDWTAPVIAAAAAVGSAGVAVSLDGPTVQLVDALTHADDTRERVAMDAALHILTSGTTGPPKRFAVRAPVLEHTVMSVTIGRAAQSGEPPELAYWPLGGIGGVCQLVTGFYLGKPLVLLERFSVAAWVRAVRTYGITRSGVQPAVVRMLLDAEVNPDDLASLDFIMCASGALDPTTRDEFEERFGIPVLFAYGATEFAGSVCTWTPDLYREFGATKRRSSGRVLPDTEVRIIDPQTGERVGVDRQGLLEAKIPLIGPDWIRTTDLASLDADGFITLHGRADGAINRGGFKILPETVRQVLVAHPAVRDACVVGVPDRRLGQVPFAAVELRPGCSASEEELKSAVRQSLPAHHVPVEIVTVDELPRNSALKVCLPAVAALHNAPRSAGCQRRGIG